MQIDLSRRAFGLGAAAFALPARAQTIVGTKAAVVLVAGATGKNGSFVVKALQAMPQFSVRGMSRNPRPSTDILWVQADVTKPETLQRALDGVTYVIDAKAATGLTGDQRPEAVDFEGTRNLAAAAKAAGVRRYVIITSSISGTVDHPMNKRGADVLIHKGNAEAELVKSGVPYTIVGPTGMNNDSPGREIKLIPRSEYKGGLTITRADTATVCIEALTNPDAANRAFSIFNGDGPATDAWKAAFAAMPRT